MEEYSAINKYCKGKKITWFASCWDEASVEPQGLQKLVRDVRVCERALGNGVK